MDCSVWVEAVCAVLATLENSLLDGNASVSTPTLGTAQSLSSRKHAQRAPSDTLSDVDSPGSPVKRRRESIDSASAPSIDGDAPRTSAKCRKVSTALSSQFARSLSMSNYTDGSDGAVVPAQRLLVSGGNCENGRSPLSSSASSISSALSCYGSAFNSSAQPVCSNNVNIATSLVDDIMLDHSDQGTPSSHARAMVYPSVSRYCKPRENRHLRQHVTKQNCSTSYQQPLHQSIDMDSSDSTLAISASNQTTSHDKSADTNMGETNSTAYEDVFAELLRPLDPSLGRLVDVESVHAAVQQWSIAMQASISGESPAILMDLLDRYISRLRELLPAIIDHIDSDNLRTRSGMYLQGEHLREFYRAVCEAASIGEWLLQRRFCLLPVLFPALVNDTRLQPILRQAIKMSRVCENMYCLVQSAPEFSLALNDMATEYEEVVNAKYACYGDIVAQDGLAWKAVGLPVEYALLARVKQWMETASSLCLSRIAHSHERRAKSSSAYNDKALSADSLLQCSIQVLHSAALSATMCGDSFNNVAPHVMYIASECTLWTCNKFKYPSTCHGDSAAWRICGKPGVQFCQGKQLSNRAMRLLAACESILKILSYAKTILVSSSKSSIFDLDIRIDHAEHVSAALETLAASVVELSWSLAEILSAFRSDGQIANPSGTMILFAEFVAKFAKRVAEFGNGRHATTDTHLRLHQIQTCVRKLASHMANS